MSVIIPGIKYKNEKYYQVVTEQ